MTVRSFVWCWGKCTLTLLHKYADRLTVFRVRRLLNRMAGILERLIQEVKRSVKLLCN